MRSTAFTTLARGRHRWGAPGLIHVSAFVTVRRRRSFMFWRTGGQHRFRATARPLVARAPEPLPAL